MTSKGSYFCTPPLQFFLFLKKKCSVDVRLRDETLEHRLICLWAFSDLRLCFRGTSKIPRQPFYKPFRVKNPRFGGKVHFHLKWLRKLMRLQRIQRCWCTYIGVKRCAKVSSLNRTSIIHFFFGNKKSWRGCKNMTLWRSLKKKLPFSKSAR